MAIAAPISSASATRESIPRSVTATAPSPPATFILAEMGYNDGWRIENHPRFAADVTGDGKADLVGFGDDGVWVSVTGGSGAKLVLAGFCYNQGWRVPLPPPLPGGPERRPQGGYHRLRRRRSLGRLEQRRRDLSARQFRARRLRLPCGTGRPVRSPSTSIPTMTT